MKRGSVRSAATVLGFRRNGSASLAAPRQRGSSGWWPAQDRKSLKRVSSRCGLRTASGKMLRKTAGPRSGRSLLDLAAADSRARPAPSPAGAGRSGTVKQAGGASPRPPALVLGEQVREASQGRATAHCRARSATPGCRRSLRRRGHLPGCAAGGRRPARSLRRVVHTTGGVGEQPTPWPGTARSGGRAPRIGYERRSVRPRAPNRRHGLYHAVRSGARDPRYTKQQAKSKAPGSTLSSVPAGGLQCLTPRKFQRAGWRTEGAVGRMSKRSGLDRRITWRSQFSILVAAGVKRGPGVAVVARSTRLPARAPRAALQQKIAAPQITRG